MGIEATIVNLSQSLSKALKDIKSIESYIFELRHSLNVALTKQKETEQEYNYTLYEIKGWTRRAELAFVNEKEDLVRVAILRKKHFIHQKQRIKKQIEDNDNAIKSLMKQVSVWENEMSRNIINEDKNTNLKERLSKLELKVGYLQNEIGDIVIRLSQTYSFPLHSIEYKAQLLDDNQLYSTKKMSALEKMEAKIREIEQESEFIVESESMSLQEQLSALEASNDVDD
ncbi:MAG: hypothetical protein QNJ32_16420 [Xenococcaceae cyanobacterium MO_167.B27]|nr:hypothetical protein [Xenococcaceae cyanobacterium MO_167.B27]